MPRAPKTKATPAGSPGAARPQAIKTDAPAGAEFEALRARLDPERMPRHLAIIMDGNGRWARRRHLPRVAGHRAGIAAVRSTVETCARLGLPVLTLYAFSAENWKRPRLEVGFLMRLLREYLRRELPLLRRHQIRLEAIGRLRELPPRVRDDLENTCRLTAGHAGMRLVLALNYGGRAELVDACAALLRRARPRARKDFELSEAAIQAHLYTAHLPDPDLILRTSGELRLSNFLLWQSAYAEFWVTPVLWPDFRPRDLFEALLEYQRRERRYGGVPPESDLE